FGTAVLLAGGLIWLLGQSLSRPLDWIGRWSAETERTDDRSFGYARVGPGTKFGPGKIGRGVELSGPECNAGLEDWLASEGSTLEFWINPITVNRGRTAICNAEYANTSPFALVMEKGEVCLAYSQPKSGIKLVHSRTFPKTNAWLHLAVTVNDRQLDLYIDGRLVAAENVPKDLHLGVGGINFGRSAVEPRHPFGDTDLFHGTIDEVALYGRTLSAAEVRQLWLATAWDPAIRRGAINVLKGILLGLALGMVVLVFLSVAGKHLAPAGSEGLSFRPRQYLVVLSVVMIGSAVSTFAFLQLRDELLKTGEQRLQDVIQEFCEQFDTRTEMYVQHFIRVREWLEQRLDVSPTQWREYVNAGSLFLECPGLVEFGFAQFVRPAEIQAHETFWALHYPGYRIHPPLSASERGISLKGFPSNVSALFPVVLYCDRRSAVWESLVFDYGWDPAAVGKDSSKVGTEAWTLSYAIGDCTVGAAVGALWGGQRIWDGADEKPARLFLPVNAERINPNPRPPDKLCGVLFASIDWSRFFQSTFQERKPPFTFRLSMNDGPDGSETLLSKWRDESAGPDSGADGITRRRAVRFYRNRIYFDFAARPELLLPGEVRWPWLIAGTGMAATWLTAGLLFVQVRARVKQELVSHQLQISKDDLRAALQDRERISRDLHDGTIQSIYAIALGLGRCRKLIERKPEIVSAQIEQSLDDLRNVITELREFLLTLEPELLKGQSFPSVLESVVERMQRTSDARLNLTQPEGVSVALEPRKAIHLLNIVREALSNSLRHGHPTEVWIIFSQANGTFRLEISDDGVGFDVGHASAGRGLTNMAERAREIGSTLQVESNPGRGTRVVVILPANGAPTSPA
ncbi:MAG: LamG-like jellyroll fold domain-containing protein, partial [Verrucomicrobiota bacterium]